MRTATALTTTAALTVGIVAGIAGPASAGRAWAATPTPSASAGLGVAQYEQHATWSASGVISVRDNGALAGDRFAFDGRAAGKGVPVQSVTIRRKGLTKPLAAFTRTGSRAYIVQPASPVRAGDVVDVKVTFPGQTVAPLAYRITVPAKTLPAPISGVVQAG